MSKIFDQNSKVVKLGNGKFNCNIINGFNNNKILKVEMDLDK